MLWSSCDLHLCLLQVLILTLKMVKCITECISIKETTKVVADQFNYIDQKEWSKLHENRNKLLEETGLRINF